MGKFSKQMWIALLLILGGSADTYAQNQPTTGHTPSEFQFPIRPWRPEWPVMFFLDTVKPRELQMNLHGWGLSVLYAHPEFLPAMIPSVEFDVHSTWPNGLEIGSAVSIHSLVNRDLPTDRLLLERTMMATSVYGVARGRDVDITLRLGNLDYSQGVSGVPSVSWRNLPSVGVKWRLDRFNPHLRGADIRWEVGWLPDADRGSKFPIYSGFIFSMPLSVLFD